MNIKLIVILIIVFLAFFYIFTFIKIRKKRNPKSDDNEKYIADFSIRKKIEEEEDLLKLDYIDRDELHKRIQNEIHPEKDEKVKINRKFEF